MANPYANPIKNIAVIKGQIFLGIPSSVSGAITSKSNTAIKIDKLINILR